MMADGAELNKALVRAWFTALSERRFADAWALDDPDGFLWVPALRDTMRLADWHLAYERLMAQQFPVTAVRYHVGPLTAEGDRVSVLTEGVGEMRNSATYRNLYHWLFVLDGGRVAGIYEYMDTHFAQVTIHAAGWNGPLEALES